MNRITNIVTKLLITIAIAIGLSGCAKNSGSPKVSKQVISNSGSDTIVNLAQMWAEAYKAEKPDVSVEVSGGGSGVGVRDLMQGVVDIANLSREMKDSEKEQVKLNAGKDPVEFVIGYDALAVYVHKDNPIEEISLEELAEIYAEGGKTEKWSQIGVDMAAIGANDEIVRVSRQNSSGTYFYFREVVMSNRDFKLGSRDMSGSKDVVELVSSTKGAVGYSGMGYVADGVKFVRLAAKKGDKAYGPSLENVAAGHYPLARPLYMFTLGQPEGAIKDYIDWIMSPAGQKIVEEAGYIPATAGKK